MNRVLSGILGLFAAAVLGMAGTAWAAGIEIREVTGRASGTSAEKARDLAIVDGVMQVNGGSVGSREEVMEQVTTILRSMPGGGVEAGAISEKEHYIDIDKETQGVISGYRVISNKQDEDGLWHAVVLVQVSVWKGDASAAGKDKIAVYPFRCLDSQYRNGAGSVDASEIAQRLKDKLEEHLTQTRKFTVVGRDNQAEMGQEKELLRSGDVPKFELVRLGKLYGSDFIVAGRVSDYDIFDDVTVGGDGVAYHNVKGARINISYELMSSVTGEVAWKGSQSIVLEAAVMRQFANNVARVRDYLIEKAASAAAFEIARAAHPPRIIAVRGPIVTVNQGNGAVHLGDIFRVFILGEELVDEETGESYGRDEVLMAKIEIIDVNDKLSHGRLIEGAALSEEYIKQGLICRPVLDAAEPSTSALMPSPPAAGVPIREDGSLPWDD